MPEISRKRMHDPGVYTSVLASDVFPLCGNILLCCYTALLLHVFVFLHVFVYILYNCTLSAATWKLFLSLLCFLCFLLYPSAATRKLFWDILH